MADWAHACDHAARAASASSEAVRDAKTFAQWAEDLFAAGDPGETAEQVVALAAAEIDIPHVGVTMLRAQHRLDTVAAASPLLARVAELEITLGEGPCLDLRWHRQTLIIPDLAKDTRWPLWSAAVADFGLGGAMYVELAADNRRMGVLTFLSTEPRDFDDEDVAFAHIFARHAALALQSAERDANLQTALDARKIIGQAQGILMERYGLTDAQAFAVLRRYSQTTNRKLRTIAVDLIRTRTLPDD